MERPQRQVHDLRALRFDPLSICNATSAMCTKTRTTLKTVVDWTDSASSRKFPTRLSKHHAAIMLRSWCLASSAQVLASLHLVVHRPGGGLSGVNVRQLAALQPHLHGGHHATDGLVRSG